MTPAMKSALDYIEAEIASKGVPPSYREIADAIGCAAISNVHRIVHSLEERGRIRLNGRGARSIELVVAHCPHCGEAVRL